jgi:hypothetical protein
MTKDQNEEVLPGKSAKISIEQTGIKAGSIICASLITYFMAMKYLSIMDSAIAWGFNFIILLAGIVLAYNYYRLKTKLNVDYIPGLILGSLITGVSVTLFVFFVYIYFSQADGMQMALLKNNILFMGEPISPLRIAGATMIEGLISGLLISFTSMQYFKSGFKRISREPVVQG